MYGEFDEDWSIPVFRRPSSGTLLRRRTIFVRGGVSPPGSWPAGGHTAVTWPGSAPTKRRSWSRRVWWRCPIITSSLNWKRKNPKNPRKIRQITWCHDNTLIKIVFFRRQLQGASSVEFFEKFKPKNIVKSYGDYPHLSSVWQWSRFFRPFLVFLTHIFFKWRWLMTRLCINNVIDEKKRLFLLIQEVNLLIQENWWKLAD